VSAVYNFSSVLSNTYFSPESRFFDALGPFGFDTFSFEELWVRSAVLRLVFMVVAGAY
jgi:hypothetical protein